MREFKEKAELDGLSLTASFVGCKDVLLNALDYPAMSNYLDFMQFTAKGRNHISDSLTMIDRLIELGVPSTKLVVGILKFGGDELYVANIASRLKINDNLIPKTEIQIESGRSIANVIRFAIKQNVAGFLTFGVNDYDLVRRSEIAIDTFADFKPKPGVVLNLPPRNDFNYPFHATINAAINVTLDEILKEKIL